MKASAIFFAGAGVFECPFAFVLCGLLATDALTQGAPRTLRPPDAISAAKLVGPPQAYELSDGVVLATSGLDIVRFDSGLRQTATIAAASILTPGSRPSRVTLIPISADSIAIVDEAGGALLILGSAGAVGRVASLPHPVDAALISANGAGMPAFDARGRLYYLGMMPPIMLPASAPPPDAHTDSLAARRLTERLLIRADLVTRQLDTLGTVHIDQVLRTVRDAPAHGRGGRVLEMQPLPAMDGWAVRQDGTIAVVRGADYHIDWVDQHGEVVHSPRLPFSWLRISELDKRRIVDSVESLHARRRELLDSAAAGVPGGRGASVDANVRVVGPEAIPDYYPPLRPGAVRVDREGNIWILPATSLGAASGLMYDVVNQLGLLWRVKFPQGCALAGFGRGGTIYTVCGGALQRTRLN